MSSEKYFANDLKKTAINLWLLSPAELLPEVVSHPRTDWGGSWVVCDGDPLLLTGPVERGLDNIL